MDEKSTMLENDFIQECKTEQNIIRSVETFLHQGVCINASDSMGLTALHMAAINGNLLLVMFLIEKGANPLAEDMDGSIPLHGATQYCYKYSNMQVIKFLSEQSPSSIMKKNNYDELPCDWIPMHKLMSKTIYGLLGYPAKYNQCFK